MNTAYGLYQTGKGAPKFEVFTSAEDASKHGNGFNIVKKQSCLNDARLFPTKFLVEIYNLKAERKVSKFRDRATAESRVWKMLTDQEASQDQIDEDSKVEEDSLSKGELRKRRAFKGHMVRVTEESNPRRKGTHAHSSWDILKNNGPMLYEDFIAAGGRRPDFAYDVNHGWAEVYQQ